MFGRCGGRRWRCRGIKRNQPSANRDRVTRFDVNLSYLAGFRAGYLHRRFVGFNLDNTLIFGDVLSFLDEDLQNVPGLDTVSQVREFYINSHLCLILGTNSWLPNLLSCERYFAPVSLRKVGIDFIGIYLERVDGRIDNFRRQLALPVQLI